MKAVAFGNFWSFGATPFNWAVFAVTHSFKVHVGELFLLEDGTTVYAEMGPFGYTGPRPFMRLLSWSKARPWRRLWIRWLPSVTAEAANEKYAQACATAHKKPYGYMDLLRIFAHETWGCGVPADPSKATCSEETAIRDFPEYECRSDVYETFDAVTPVRVWDVVTANPVPRAPDGLFLSPTALFALGRARGG